MNVAEFQRRFKDKFTYEDYISENTFKEFLNKLNIFHTFIMNDREPTIVILLEDEWFGLYLTEAGDLHDVPSSLITEFIYEYKYSKSDIESILNYAKNNTETIEKLLDDSFKKSMSDSRQLQNIFGENK